MIKSDERGTDYKIQNMDGKKKERSVRTVRVIERAVLVDMICVLCKRCYDKEYKRKYT